MYGELIPESVKKTLLKQKYHIVGRHSAVKTCRWVRKSLVENTVCYKSKFYGIQTHRCLQMTCALNFCTQQCLYCWRYYDSSIDRTKMTDIEVDDPQEIIQGALIEQKRLLSGYNPKAHNKVDPLKYSEALSPKHVAISLSGEPTLYPRLGELIEEFHRMDFTTFLVTNGTVPERLSEITEPTQLYVSVSAPTEEIYRRLCRPQIHDGWQKLNETLEMLHSFSCPTVLRLTLVKQHNLEHVEDYAKLIAKAESVYIEPKAYMWVGHSRDRLALSHMPTHEEIREFSENLSQLTGYRILDESTPSRVVLLSKLAAPMKLI
ncbi:4-demethylwyosine synthase TYW1 [Candidatus Borrarchaeum sp.]|uniref:4-demethylwyosine synthase TYW1 n=1 Tax=Candidatus Borrarchaeum sp. TaxID=2846742 RepID=UPI00257EF79A|nr:4-demethylwyosine synthase TYW1 [Candidatus Borrarchaeum sp.]